MSFSDTSRFMRVIDSLEKSIRTRLCLLTYVHNENKNNCTYKWVLETCLVMDSQRQPVVDLCTLPSLATCTIPVALTQKRYKRHLQTRTNEEAFMESIKDLIVKQKLNNKYSNLCKAVAECIADNRHFWVLQKEIGRIFLTSSMCPEHVILDIHVDQKQHFNPFTPAGMKGSATRPRQQVISDLRRGGVVKRQPCLVLHFGLDPPFGIENENENTFTDTTKTKNTYMSYFTHKYMKTQRTQLQKKPSACDSLDNIELESINIPTPDTVLLKNEGTQSTMSNTHWAVQKTTEWITWASPFKKKIF